MYKSAIIITALLVMLMSGCASTTATGKYVQADGYRYIEHKITDNYFLLNITSKDKTHIDAYGLKQASILTDQQGYDWFIIVEQSELKTAHPRVEKVIEIRMGKGVKP
ncbi:hypothetical protein H5202_03580 [Shewanella sp. SG41-4]|uniref:CC0125/CC1285 family lipoprotein n=1 Tax=Shewanella sp. SG41-4 TaxID=2760976 RepID=UPI0016003AF5|nr:hypothetical protein [Shewanella sp. SG41-4]MBB1437771.1 hypothetical protein [Shewanella sp. SG41-4]